ncbi:hypothetical protein HUT18_09675 [Streptomyces sp. NA04227]|uniref:hypothetical protein n=1 Tax=Streptomyces sp. NA04227 TaxID=2742136 RepID=UPI00159271D5|nr:hypothetical protein [Streptomyces sp. NA04227]QKW06630.1 hypothetical protein HUT18_09675 [Streptomyces sp. NA04227]
MVTSSHEAMHRVFQEDPNVFARTFRRFGLEFGEFADAVVISPDLTEIRPVERRTDTLIRFTTSEGRELLLLVEAQRRKDIKKPRSWAYYLAYTQAKYESAEATLLVVCQDRRTADWARGPFSLGPPQWATLKVQPLVIGPQNMPLITDVAKAAEDITPRGARRHRPRQ